ncbi:MAG: ribose 5-phosphate isomerase B [Deltaproteobacteria bacterium]|nr:MAG: ribose 5-phosphate isomerase B [Deltaproteobacteria bacterium]
MSIAIASDHGGFELKEEIKKFLLEKGEELLDLGTNTDTAVDYPEYGMKVAEKVSRGEVEKGILICGTGIGMSIVANKFSGIRAALVTNEFMARMAKEHNNANILVLGGRVTDCDKSCRLVEIWLSTKFAGERHQRRLDKIKDVETKLGG